MKSFTFTVPQNIIVGQGSIARLPEAVRALGASRVFFVSDPFLAKVGAVQKCMDQLTKAGVTSEAFTETEGNPSVETVDRATARFKASGADCIVALGGGSPMDVAKAVGVLARYGGSIMDYEGGGKVPVVPDVEGSCGGGRGEVVRERRLHQDHDQGADLRHGLDFPPPRGGDDHAARGDDEAQGGDAQLP